MSINNGRRARAQVERKKKVLRRLRARELRKSLAVKPNESTTENAALAAPKTADAK